MTLNPQSQPNPNPNPNPNSNPNPRCEANPEETAQTELDMSQKEYDRTLAAAKMARDGQRRTGEAQRPSIFVGAGGGAQGGVGVRRASAARQPTPPASIGTRRRS